MKLIFVLSALLLSMTSQAKSLNLETSQVIAGDLVGGIVSKSARSFTIKDITCALHSSESGEYVLKNGCAALVDGKEVLLGSETSDVLVSVAKNFEGAAGKFYTEFKKVKCRNVLKTPKCSVTY